MPYLLAKAKCTECPQNTKLNEKGKETMMGEEKTRVRRFDEEDNGDEGVPRVWISLSFFFFVCI